MARRSAAALVLGAALLAVGAGPSASPRSLSSSTSTFKSASKAAPASGSLAFRLTGEPETLDWNKAHTPVETYVLLNLMEGLVSFDASSKVVPALAQSWKVSKDQREYTFKLRPGVLWSDGVALKAADFVASWRRLLSPVTGASYAYLLFDVEGAEAFHAGKQADFAQVGVRAPDDHTLVVRLARPVAHWINIPTFWVTFPIRKDVVDRHGPAWATPGRMVSLGPFTLLSHDAGQRIVLQANPRYWGGKPRLEQATGLIVADDSTALTLYETGKLDILTDIPALDLGRLRGRPEFKTFPYLKTGYLGLVTEKYPLSEPRMRRAVARAIDRKRIGEILHGGQTAAQSFLPPTLEGWSADDALTFDPKAAKAELLAALPNGGKPPKLDLVVLNSEKALLLGQWLQGELKRNLGVEVGLQPFDNKTFRAQVDLRAWAMFQLSWSADYPDPDNFLSMWLSASGNNRTGWKNAEYDRAVLAARGAKRGSPERKRLIRRALEILLREDAVIVPLYHEPNLALVRARVRGFALNPLNYLYLKGVDVGGPASPSR